MYAKFNAFIATATFLSLLACGQIQEEASTLASLTGDDYVGTKYYYGWGAASRNDPALMHNEVKYDVLHTHNIFTDEVGGNYHGTKDIGTQVSRNKIRQQWQNLQSTMTKDDMYVQYSSGHGYASGLAVGVSYDEMRDFSLALPAQEIVIFTMACQSGGLVDSFNRRRRDWENWEAAGRTLMVMASSRTQENSSTGPGRDQDEPGGPYGSAGSAFGHALWKALIGYADGYGSGVKDGYLSLQEIIDYTKYRTRQIGGHTPQVTGSFNANLIMNRVPGKEFLASIDGGTENMSDEEITAMIETINQNHRL